MSKDMTTEIKQVYGDDYFQERVSNMKSFLKNGTTDFQPVISAYTNALRDVFPQKR